MSVEILSTTAQLYKKSHLKRPANQRSYGLYITSYQWSVVTASVSCTVSEILPVLTACHLEKYFSFNATVEITGYVYFPIHVQTYRS